MRLGITQLLNDFTTLQSEALLDEKKLIAVYRKLRALINYAPDLSFNYSRIILDRSIRSLLLLSLHQYYSARSFHAKLELRTNRDAYRLLKACESLSLLHSDYYRAYALSMSECIRYGRVRSKLSFDLPTNSEHDFGVLRLRCIYHLSNFEFKDAFNSINDVFENTKIADEGISINSEANLLRGLALVANNQQEEGIAFLNHFIENKDKLVQAKTLETALITRDVNLAKYCIETNFENTPFFYKK
ncbi:MAG: hypothetical protein HQK50_09385 [Oligoflexia bacterium]|nr:hypothetical protein [Oligoflexia bacterium]